MPQAISEIAVTIARFEIPFATICIFLVAAGFVVNQFNGQAALCGFDQTCLVIKDSLSEIIRASNIPVVIRFGVQHVNVIHIYFTGRV